MKEEYKEKEKPNFFTKVFNIFGNDKKETRRDENVLSNTMSAINTNKDMWVPDDKAVTCLYGCGKQFSALFLRKHHCRICGNVFCKDCCSKTVEGTYWGINFLF